MIKYIKAHYEARKLKKDLDKLKLRNKEEICFSNSNAIMGSLIKSLHEMAHISQIEGETFGLVPYCLYYILCVHAYGCGKRDKNYNTSGSKSGIPTKGPIFQARHRVCHNNFLGEDKMLITKENGWTNISNSPSFMTKDLIEDSENYILKYYKMHGIDYNLNHIYQGYRELIYMNYGIYSNDAITEITERMLSGEKRIDIGEYFLKKKL